jgi:hypothetical protein
MLENILNCPSKRCSYGYDGEANSKILLRGELRRGEMFVWWGTRRPARSLREAIGSRARAISADNAKGIAKIKKAEEAASNKAVESP